MNKDEIEIITEQLKLVVQVSVNDMEKRLSAQTSELNKEIADLKVKLEAQDKRNQVVDLISQHDEIFNPETLPEVRKYLLTMIEREKKRQQFNDWAMKTLIGSLTLTALTVFYTVGKFILANLNKIG